MTTELLTDPGHSRADLVMIQRAVKKWVIPDQLLEALPKVAGAMALTGKPREKLGAMAVLLEMKKQNDKATPEQAVGRGHTINVGVNVGSVPDSGRGLASVVLARLRDDGLSGIDAGRDQK